MLQPTWSPGSLSGDLAVAERIAARDLNNLYLTSCFFRERERYAAFCSLYAVMRVIDDRIDNLPGARRAAAAVIAAEQEVAGAWEQALLALVADPGGARVDHRACGHDEAGLLLTHAAAATRRLGVPVGIWREFFAAMQRDIVASGLFPTFDDFLAYTQGASVAPTTIYLYILMASFEGGAQPAAAQRDHVAALGQALGRFAYLGHVVRDLPMDVVTGEQGLWYVSRADLDAFGLGEESIRADVARARSSAGLTQLVAALVERAWAFHRDSRALLARNEVPMRRDCAFVLELIIRIYEGVLRKVESCGFDVLQNRHHLTREEKGRVALEVARDLGL